MSILNKYSSNNSSQTIIHHEESLIGPYYSTVSTNKSGGSRECCPVGIGIRLPIEA
jgi:hypothetical protein